jgi:anti-sigma factor RsiW
MLDRRMKEPLKRRMQIHLTNCTECSARLERRRKAHAALFRALNHFDGREHLSESFAERLVAECRRPQPWWQNVAAPKWALIAASLVLMAGFVFAATVVVDAVIAKDDDRKGTQATEVTDGSDALAAPADVPCVSDVSSVPSTDNQPPPINNQQSTLKGEQAMTKRKAAATALTAAMAVAPLAAANGDEYQFIVSGELVAVTTGCSSDSSETSSLTSGTLADGVVYGSEFEARYRTMDDSNTCSLRSDKAGLVISFK